MILIASLAYFVLFFASVPLYLPLVVLAFFNVKHVFKFLILAIFLMTFVVALAFFPAVYMEITDLTLWVFTITFLYVFSRMDVSFNVLKNSLYFLSALQLLSGTADLFSKLTLNKKIINFFPNYEVFAHDKLSDVGFFLFDFYRVQGLLPEPSYFGIISVFLFISFKILIPTEKLFSIFLVISVFLSYSILAITVLLIYYTFSFFTYTFKAKVATLLIALILIPIIIYDGSIINQFYIKLSGEHISGFARYTKFMTAIDLIVERPFFGYQPGYFVSIMNTQPGNVYVTLLLENGFIGFLLFAFFIWYIYRPVFKMKYLNILVAQFCCFFFMQPFYIPIFFLPLIYCYHKDQLNNKV